VIRALALAAAVLAAGGCGTSNHASQPGLVVGVVEDAAKNDPGPELRRTADSGFGAVALSAVWSRGERQPPPGVLGPLRRAVATAARDDVRPIVALYQFSSQTPVTPGDRADFAAYAAALVRGLPQLHDLIVGNEPNLNLFWQPQFDAAGGDAAAASFEALLAETYDAVKAARDDVQVIGAGLSPRGSDDPTASRQTHSPTRFLLDLGAAYRASRRDRPLMDAFSIHPYGESPRVAPTLAHPHTTSIGIADYGKLVRLLGRAFDGTAQPGRKLPIVYGEYGVETAIPPAKRHLYTGTEVVPAVDEATQARDYTTAIALAACQSTVRMLLLFHLEDEPQLAGLQSGVRYADGSPKTSERPVAKAAAHPHCGSS
jgi:hypothetical protein